MSRSVSKPLKPSVLTFSIFAVIFGQSAYANDVNEELADVLGYNSHDITLSQQDGGSAVFDLLDEVSNNLIVAADTGEILETDVTNTASSTVDDAVQSTSTNTVVKPSMPDTSAVAADAEKVTGIAVEEKAVETVSQVAEDTRSVEQPAAASQQTEAEVVSEKATVDTTTEPVDAQSTQPVKKAASAPAKEATPSMVPPKQPVTAGDALKQKDDDASTEKNLEEVFTASEKRYSLLKQGNWGLNYDARYSYYRDSRIDIATAENSSDIRRFRVEEDAQHTLTNSFNIQYGLKDNLTLSADLPIVAKTDLGKDANTVGLGDITLGARWEPFPLEKDRLPLIFNGNVTLPTGKSPYEIDRARGLSTGRGYYGIGGGVSTRKYIDPVVLFGSASLNYGFEQDGLDQRLGGDKTLVAFRPNLGGGIALGFAYSLNYDVSLTMSYQQSFSVGSEFTRRQLENKKLVERSISSADQTSATLNMALGVRVSPKTIVNTSVGIGLTEDTPDVSFGVSFPLDFVGLGKKK